jgi:PilZ domain
LDPLIWYEACSRDFSVDTPEPIPENNPLSRVREQKSEPRAAEGAASERRAQRRAVVELPTMIDSAAAHAAGRSLNVSAGGIALTINGEFSIGALVDVYFELPIGVSVEAKGQVVRRSENELALRFVDLDAKAALALRSFCRVSGLSRPGQS